MGYLFSATCFGLENKIWRLGISFIKRLRINRQGIVWGRATSVACNITFQRQDKASQDQEQQQKTNLFLAYIYQPLPSKLLVPSDRWKVA